MLVTENLSYKVKNISILSNINMEIKPAALNIILGPNGAGKSTLFKLFSNAIRPSEGHIYFANKEIHTYTLKELSERMIVMTQHYSMSLPFTVEEVVLMGRYPFFKNHSSATDMEVMEKCMKLMEIYNYKDRIFNSLSGGEQQRTQLARILCQLHGIDGIYTNKILLLDEPNSAMDFYHQQILLQYLKHLTSLGCTIVMILHDLQLCAQFADNIVLLNKGKIEIQGNIEKVLSEYNLKKVYNINTTLIHDPKIPYPIIVPLNN